MTTSNLIPRELDHRSGNGIHVTLLWHPAADTVTVEVYDETFAEAFRVEVPPSRALDAFRHPYAYAPAVESGVAGSRAEAVDA